MSTAGELARAAEGWLAMLSADQRDEASFPFETDERYVWAFTPGDRQGLALRDMDAAQRAAAMRMIAAALSVRGAREVGDVIALETVLGKIERDAGGADWRRRDPDMYWFALFGDPAGHAAPWMWRIGGHHVAIHMTVADGVIVGSTPSFLGANPAVIPAGPRAGERTLTGEETLARALLASLDDAARAFAVVDPTAPPEILTSNAAHADVSRVPHGLRHADMGPTGRAALERLIRHYLGRAAADVAAADWDRAIADDLPETTFAWAGPTEPGRGHYYAVRGGRLLIEYDNTQNGANHIHAVWRDVDNDWGGDVLAAHLRAAHGAGG